MAHLNQKVGAELGARLESIFDKGTFVELGAYTKRVCSEEALAGVVCGYGSVCGKLAFAFAQDSSRAKGVFGEKHAKKIIDMYSLAVKNGAPVIGVFDSAGASVYDGATALAAYGSVMKCVSDASGIIPQLAVIDGICGGMNAVLASMFDLTIAIKDTAKLFVNAPFTVGKEKGTADFAADKGLAAIVADNAGDAYARVRELIMLLPSNNSDAAIVETSDSFNRESVFDAEKYTAEELISALCDKDSFIELYAAFAEGATLGLATFGGNVCGVVLVNGKLGIKCARATAKLVAFCDGFGIPVVTLVDSEGLEVSGEAEDAAFASELARLAYAYSTADNAKVTAIIGKAYGASFTLLGSKAMGADMVYSLPTACVSVLSPEASVAFVWNAKVGKEGTRDEVEAEWREKCASADDALERGEIDDVIESSELRKRICASLMMLATKAEGKPSRRHANMPL